MAPITMYDFGALEQQARSRVDTAAGIVGRARTTIDARSMNGATEATQVVADAISNLIEVSCEGLSEALLAAHPFVRALARALSHPRMARNLTRSPSGPLRGALESITKLENTDWSVRSLLVDLAEGYSRVHAESQSSQLESPSVFELVAAWDEFGAFTPSFTRADAYAGDVWLLQSDRGAAHLDKTAASLDLYALGFVPTDAILASGHHVIACIERVRRPAAQIIRSIEWSGFVDSWQHVRWQRGVTPLDVPDFALLPATEVGDAHPLGSWPGLRGTAEPPTAVDLLKEGERAPPMSALRQSLLERVLAGGTGPEWAQAHLLLSDLESDADHPCAAVAHLDAVRACTDPARAPTPLRAAAELYAQQWGDAPIDAPRVAHALAICEAAGREADVVLALTMLADHAHEHGDRSAARGYALRMVRLAEPDLGQLSVPKLLRRLAEYAADDGDLPAALDYIDRALAHLQAGPPRPGRPRQIPPLRELRARLVARAGAAADE